MLLLCQSLHGCTHKLYYFILRPPLIGGFLVLSRLPISFRIYRILRPTGPLDRSEEIDGAGLETVFFQSARALNDYLNLGYNIHYWHPVGGNEVDFVLYGPQGLLAFEIKRTKTVSSKALRGLKAFGEEYPEAKLYLIFGGNHREYHGAITAIPMEEALVNLPQILNLTPLV